MTTYYLQDSQAELRFILDTRLHAAAMLVRSVEAGCWLGAKKALGFALSDVQCELLARREPA